MIERRLVRSSEVRTTREGHIDGHAAVFNQEYVLWDGDTHRVVETVKPGAFSRALREQHDVRALLNHDPNHLLGRTASGTLALKEDSVGLHFDVEPPDTLVGRDVYTLVKRGDITGCSFAFTVTKESVKESKESGKIVRRRAIEDVDLFDVGPVTFPAYTGTDVNARTMELRSMMFPHGVPACLRLAASFAENDTHRSSRRKSDAEALEDFDRRMALWGMRQPPL
jgi:HK97 family phage prohead protease